MAGRGDDADRVRAGGVGALACALAALAAACYPNPDDLRSNRSGASGGTSGAVGGSNGSGGTSTGAGGNGPGAGGSLGAGGGAPSAQCGKPACGGSVLGNWAFVSSCSSVTSQEVANCPGGTIDASGVHRSGSISFSANSTYSTTETDTGSFIFDAPTACLGGGTCAALEAAFQEPGSVGQPNPTFSSATCSTTATGCRCTLGALGMPMTITGTYVSSGTALTLTTSTGVVDADTFCVAGSNLHLIYPDSTPSVPDEAVFMKQ